MALTISLLGPFQATVDNSALSESRAKKIEALLIYLVLESRVAHRREMLVGLLFPDMPEDAARTNLRQTLTRLRRAIKDSEAKPPYLLITRETTQFNVASRTTVDVRQFEALQLGCQRHINKPITRCPDCITRLESATELYRGPFLDGFFLEESVAFEEWVAVYRERYRQQAIGIFQTVSDYYERRGAYGRAQHFVERLLEIEPWDEGTLQQYLRLLAYQGKRTVALAAFEKFCDRLEEELGVPPTEETAVLRQQIAAMVEKRPYALPQRRTELIGREEELALIHEQIVTPESRLLTLVGHGGMGKTSLAIEAGWRTVEASVGPFMHGTFFVPLAGLAHNSGIEGITTAVAEKLGYTFDAATPPLNQLLSYLRDKALFLILDNVEHVLEIGRDVINQIMQSCPSVKVMVTSRERLNLMMEWVHTIEGLPVPPSMDELSDFEAYGAVALFLERARQSDAKFQLSDEADSNLDRCTQKTAVQICQQLHGMPLAIELAAPMTRLMTCYEIYEEISQNYKTLSSKMHHLPPRHQSIQAVFESSWELLSKDEQEILVNLSIFRGGFDRQAAQQIAGASLETLSNLLDKSLLNRVGGTNGRFMMQEMLRQFSNSKQSEQPNANGIGLPIPPPPSQRKVAQDHANHYLTLLAGLYDDLTSEAQIDALTAISNDIENIRLAWHTAVNNATIPLLHNSLETLSLFFYMRSWLTEAANLFRQSIKTLMLIPNQDRETATFITMLQAHQGWFTFLLGQQKEGIKLLEGSLAQLEGGEETAVYPTSYLAAAYQLIGQLDPATQTANTGLALSQTHQNSVYQAINNNILSQIAYQQGAYDEARRYGETSLSIERKLGNRWSMGFSLTNLGRSAYAEGDYAQARQYYEESLTIRTALKDVRGQAICLTYLGDSLLAEGEDDAARQQYEKAKALYQTINSQTGLEVIQLRLNNMQ